MQARIRSSLLVVVLLASGLVPDGTAAPADDLPADTNVIQSLTPDQARRLVTEFPGVDLVFDLHGFGTPLERRCLPLSGLQSLDAEVAAILASHRGPLLVNGLTRLPDEAARPLARHGGPLQLDGLGTLSVETATILAQRASGWLSLGGLTALSGEAAEALAGHSGPLVLNGLTRLSPEAARALAKHKSALYLHGLTTLSAETAGALAAARNWDGNLPKLTSLDSPDSVAIATALATRPGRLALPGLEKLSPLTLSALIAKPDIEIPLIETLQFIPEPDGRATDDFVIPQWLEERQKKRRATRPGP